MRLIKYEAKYAIIFICLFLIIKNTIGHYCKAPKFFGATTIKNEADKSSKPAVEMSAGMANKLFSSAEKVRPLLRFNSKEIPDEIPDETREIDFADCNTLTCRTILSQHDAIYNQIWALETYTTNGRQYLVSASNDDKVKVWDLTKNKLATSLKGHKGSVNALALYVKNGVQMLASASYNKVNLWDLSTNTYVRTLSDHHGMISSLVAYKRKGKSMLACGSWGRTIKIWDLDKYKLTAVLPGHADCVRSMCVYHQNGKSYLASGSCDKTIKIWSLDDYTLVTDLHKDTSEIYAMVLLDHNGQQILASGHIDGKIKLFSLEQRICVGIINAHTNRILTLEVSYCNGKVCLVSSGFDRAIKVWDLDSRSEIAFVKSDADIYSIRAFMNGNRACLASGDGNDDIKLWME